MNTNIFAKQPIISNDLNDKIIIKSTNSEKDWETRLQYPSTTHTRNFWSKWKQWISIISLMLPQ